jgi:homoserine kinase type II
LNAVTQLDALNLEDALSNYDIGRLKRYWPAANGIENSNYFVETEADGKVREFVLTIMEQDANAGAAYIPMMKALYRSGLPVAPPLRNAMNYYIEQVGGKPALLQPRLGGQHVFNPTSHQVCALARFVARMHLSMARTDVDLPVYPRDARWLAEHTGMTQGYLSYPDAKLLQTTVSKVSSLLARADVQALPTGMIHGDLFRDNALFNAFGLTGVLDFHHAATGYWIYDLAVIANDWCNDAGGQLDSDSTTAMLRAYHQIRPLQASELWFFPVFALYAAVTFWLSRLNVSLGAQAEDPSRCKNPDEFKRIVAHHTRHSFYLDPRRLSV